MKDDTKVSLDHSLAPAPGAPPIDHGRRGLAGLLALFGGGAALASCGSVEGAEIVGRSETATTSGLVVETAATLAALRLLTDTNADCVAVRGAVAANDGGHGLFTWDSASTETDDKGLCIKPTSVSGAGRWKRMFSGPINVRWFAERNPNGWNDWAPAIQAAVDAARTSTDGPFSSPRALAVYIPAGVYDVRSRIVVDATTTTYRGVVIQGDGPVRTVVKFYPQQIDAVLDDASVTAADCPAVVDGSVDGSVPLLDDEGYATCFAFTGTSSSGRLFAAGLRDMSVDSFTPSGGAFAKRAVLLKNVDAFLMENICFQGEWGDYCENKAIVIQGGQQITLRDITYRCGVVDWGTPIYLQEVPNSLGVDHLHMFNIHVQPGLHRHAIEAAPDTRIANMLLIGANVSGGNGVLLWNDGINAQQSNCGNIAIRDVRFEGGEGSGSTYAVDIPRAVLTGYPATNLIFENVKLSSTRQGMRLDLCVYVSLINCFFDQASPFEALRLDHADNVELINCHFETTGKVVLGTDRMIERADTMVPGASFPATARVILTPVTGTAKPAVGVSVTHFTKVLDAGGTFRIPSMQTGFQQVAHVAVTARVAPTTSGALPSAEHGEYALAYSPTGFHNVVALVNGTTRMLAASGADSADRTMKLGMTDKIVLDAQSYNTIWVRNQTSVGIQILVEVVQSSGEQPVT